MSALAPDTAAQAREYYNTSSADAFYHGLWGGEDIHVGWYLHPREEIAQASRRTVERMALRLPHLARSARVLDLGSGYGGAARLLAGRFGRSIDCLNVSEVQNERNRSLNRAQGLDALIQVRDGVFEDLSAFHEGAYDAVWCQDALLHSSDRRAVLHGVGRVLKPGGDFVFTDPMQWQDDPDVLLAPVYERLQLGDMASPEFYRRCARELGWQEVAWRDATGHLHTHYQRVLDELQCRRADMVKRCGAPFGKRMEAGLGHWVRAAALGRLAWGIFHFKKEG